MILGALIENFSALADFACLLSLGVSLSNDRAVKASLRLRAVPTVTSVGEILWNCQSHCVPMRGGVAASFRFSERAGL